ncbi:TetR/AcrR family transcriptional regulator [Pelagibacterium halotolerans]|uniref:Transcriptional regulator, TetR family n=1 Tax=Pelagibacterium halotolerans (strain DSM 22347 / JCM 15775 / CGMCC 1.7692 / B2) TaxID=1082931 RepID=G4RC63_PELHB|nr:TetR/AcrR family transcriptional regulator [Pelagibacterium halotolerans]AEQ52686.1 transcriptional regulator, TetR family [Pelagibacterium halotolerans B2]QJR17612.1 TetR/AcrR family transcriptional regulator [Pelagibacterium halotolerans]SEA84436.1 transcriptional regulator, TetR family [Pelagibacterium halotolerans]
MSDKTEEDTPTVRWRRKSTSNAAMREMSMQRITEAAFRLFVVRGYEATTLQQIADEVNMTKGAIFFYFQSKENLLLHLLASAEEAVVSTFIEKVDSSNASPSERIVDFFHHGARQGLEAPYRLLCLIQISIVFSGQDNEIGRRVTDIYRRIYEHLTGIVEEGQKVGAFNNDIKPSEFVSMIVAMHDGMMLEWQRRGGEIDGRLLVQAVRVSMLNGMLAQGSR